MTLIFTSRSAAVVVGNLGWSRCLPSFLRLTKHASLIRQGNQYYGQLYPKGSCQYNITKDKIFLVETCPGLLKAKLSILLSIHEDKRNHHGFVNDSYTQNYIYLYKDLPSTSSGWIWKGRFGDIFVVGHQRKTLFHSMVVFVFAFNCVISWWQCQRWDLVTSRGGGGGGGGGTHYILGNG